MIEYYSTRAKVESGSKELEHEIGTLDSQCRNENAVENHLGLCCLAMTLTGVYAPDLYVASKSWQQSQRFSASAFADIRQRTAEELRGEPVLREGCAGLAKGAVELIRDRLLN